MLITKELIVGKALSESCLFIPYYPKPEECKSDLEMLEMMGYSKNGKVQQFDETKKRLDGYSRVMFCSLVDEAYIGLLF